MPREARPGAAAPSAPAHAPPSPRPRCGVRALQRTTGDGRRRPEGYRWIARSSSLKPSPACADGSMRLPPARARPAGRTRPARARAPGAGRARARSARARRRLVEREKLAFAGGAAPGPERVGQARAASRPRRDARRGARSRRLRAARARSQATNDGCASSGHSPCQSGTTSSAGRTPRAAQRAQSRATPSASAGVTSWIETSRLTRAELRR